VRVATAAALGVVIPTLNEAPGIDACLAAIAPLRDAGAEVVVSDGGSDDGTPQRAAARGATVIVAPRGRASQLNAGAAGCRAGLLAFLHADCRPTPEACARLLQLCRSPEPLWGRFDVSLSGTGGLLFVIGASMNLRSRLTGIATGDQLMFVSRSLFQAVGGFPGIPLMEDIALSRALKTRRPPVCPRERVLVSSRKWREEGVLRTMILMWRLRAAYALGADPARLARRYYSRG
jgi:rSAM/selenodomain-associated transferase 2